MARDASAGKGSAGGGAVAGAVAGVIASWEAVCCRCWAEAVVGGGLVPGKYIWRTSTESTPFLQFWGLIFEIVTVSDNF